MEQEAVLSQALALPEEERAEVAARLLESLGGPGQAMSDDELRNEARGRSEDMNQDPGNSVAHEVFIQQFRERRK